MNKKVILIIMDGIGISQNTKGNAVHHAKKENLDKLLNEFPNTTLEASGEAVGLPAGQMGNSEVGHLNIGAGRIVYTGLSIINNAIKTKEFYKNEALNAAIEHSKKNNSKVHLFALTSKGGVHASWDHIVETIKFCKTKDANVVFHAVSDGRDVAPQSFKEDVSVLYDLLKENNVKLGTICGRYFAMDRDKNWDRSEIAYQTLLGKCDNAFSNPVKYVEDSYASGVNDEFIKPAINSNYKVEEIKLNDGDAFVSLNFRPDRSRQMCHLVYGSNYYEYVPKIRKENIFLVTMMSYEGIVPNAIAFPATKLENVLGKVLEDDNLTQLRIAETEKYAHVTFFFDGGIEVNYKNEKKVIIQSPKVATYDLKPEMSAYEVCDKLLENMSSTDVIVCNFANGDMVGHTGNLEATIKAVETVDKCIGKIYEKAKETNTTLFITADHGNADQVSDDEGKPVTSHTVAPVPFIVTDASLKLASNGKLSNIAPTILKYLGKEIPKEMTEKPLI